MLLVVWGHLKLEQMRLLFVLLLGTDASDQLLQCYSYAAQSAL